MFFQMVQMNIQQCLMRGRLIWHYKRPLSYQPVCTVRLWQCVHVRTPKSGHRTQKIFYSSCVSYKHNVKLVQRSDFPLKYGYACKSTRSTSDYSEVNNAYNNDEEEEEEEDENEEDRESRAEAAEAELAHIFSSKSDLSNSEWRDVIELVAQTNPALTERSCDALMMLQCLRRNSWPLGKSYMEFLARQGREPNLATLSSYLQLCGLNVDKCGQETVLQLYRQLTSRTKVSGQFFLIIYGNSNTVNSQLT